MGMGENGMESITGKMKLLVVDDIELNRLILMDMFQNQFEVLCAQDGKVALDFIEQYGEEIAVVLLDLVMPVMDGFSVLKKMHKSGIIKTVPVVMITGENDDDKMLTGYQLGVSDLVNKPFNADIVYRRVNNVVELYNHKREMERELKKQKEMLEKQAERLRQGNQFVIDALSTTVEFRDQESGEHILRIRTLVELLMRALQSSYAVSEEEIEMISNASAMHDIGKIAIPDSILLKPGRLTAEEFEVMKTHTIKGCNILARLDYMQDKKYYAYCYEICRHHHERWDGKGYPDGLKGEEISVWAQVTSIADVYDALTSERVYKAAYTHEKAVEMILNGECGMFNPRLLDAFVQIQEDLRKRSMQYAAKTQMKE